MSAHRPSNFAKWLAEQDKPTILAIIETCRDAFPVSIFKEKISTEEKILLALLTDDFKIHNLFDGLTYNELDHKRHRHWIKKRLRLHELCKKRDGGPEVVQIFQELRVGRAEVQVIRERHRKRWDKSTRGYQSYNINPFGRKNG